MLAKRVRSIRSLTPLVRPIDHVETVVERILHHAHGLLHSHLGGLVCIGCRSVREKRLVDFQQSALVVNEQVQDVRLVLAREVAHLHSVLCQLGQSQKGLLKLLCLLRTLVKLLELLSVVNFILQSAFHNFLTHFFNALNKEGLKFIALSTHVDAVSNDLLGLLFLAVDDILEVPDCVCVAGL